MKIRVKFLGWVRRRPAPTGLGNWTRFILARVAYVKPHLRLVL